MEFRISDTFTDSLARLTGEEQKAVKTTAFDMQLNPANPGMSFHKLDRAKDKNFWSVRVNDDIRLIVHKTPASLLLCYVDHHDKAYAWAERRKLETHPKTGAAQLVEIREMVKEVVVPIYVQPEAKKELEFSHTQSPIFLNVSDEVLLSYGVPIDWLADVRNATEDTLFDLTDHLPAEAAEALLELATGGTPYQSKPDLEVLNPFDHPDAQRRFRIMTNVEELSVALDYPWEKWTVFLHPEQKLLVEREINGHARVSGSAGTGKTIVAIHRAVNLARIHPESRVLLTTFSDTLANALKIKLKRLLGNEPKLAERIDIYSINAIGIRLYKLLIGPINIAGNDIIYDLLKEFSAIVGGHKFNLHFLITEWVQIVDGWQLTSWEEYRDVSRLGRKTRLPEEQRNILWKIFERVRTELKKRKLNTYAGLFYELAAFITKTKKSIFDSVVVDECQDLTISHIRFFSSLGNFNSNSLFFTGDLGQRIFQQPFSWKALGIDVRGRSRILRVNYRTSHQIRAQADKLLSSEIIDFDGISENRNNTISVFNGPPPIIISLKSENDEIETVSKWISEQMKAGLLPHEFGVFVRSEAQIDRAKAAIKKSGLSFKVLDEHVETTSGYVSICTMHLAKGLEFRAVVVMACDDEIIPLQSRIETVGDDADLQEVYDTERHLLYVACTRARDNLLITGVEPISEFIDDMKMEN